MMCKRQLLQAIERMPNEAEVEIPWDGSPRPGDPALEALQSNASPWSIVKRAEFVDGKIRIS